ncbi:uncharacterized protein LOC126814850 [Patella vulgata]|uniref:uncharacterized protein LOC126814850 n=1 Tax=Patella vulgata TaxID=6465 RepID=UPI00217FC431|nr:uncharacterized protein LOC126814850 [Patella vulgata]
MLTGARPTGLHYSPLARRRQEPHDNSCDRDVCSHQCVRVPSTPDKPFKCQCPDGSSKILSSNQATCERPANFVLFADLNSLKMVSLDPESESTVHTIQYGHIRSNFVAVAYDKSTDTIYWSDITEKSIYSSPFNGIEPKLIYRSTQFIEGITVDSDRQRLFWTGYLSNGTGVVARMNLQRGPSSYHEVKKGLNKPKAILFFAKKKMLFWTDFGGNNYPASVHRSRANGKHHKVIMSDGLFWPNALASQDSQLYVGDGSGKVFQMNFDGSDRRELTFLSGSDVFGMAVFDKVLFYSDWYTNSVYMVDMVTGDQETVATHLSRPTSIVIYHPNDLSKDNLCNEDGEEKCSAICVPVPRSYHCTCNIGSKLAADGKNCIQMSSPWVRTEERRCGDGCGKNSQCAQRVPLLEYICVCKAGYYLFDGDCIGCGENMYKSSLGNEACDACPFDTSTQGATASSQCYCDRPNRILVNNTCIATAVTTVNSMTTEEVTTSTSKMVTMTTSKMVTKDSEMDWLDITTSKSVDHSFVPRGVTLAGATVSGVTFDYEINGERTQEPLHEQTHAPYVERTQATADETTHIPVRPTTEDIEPLIDVTMVTKDTASSIQNNGGYPYFENCPHDSVITVTLPPDSNRYLYPVEWSAYDSYKNRLPMTSNYQIVDRAISLMWKGRGSEGIHMVVFQAEDNWKRKKTCQFEIQVDDVTAPVFTYCPRNLLIKSDQPMERVVWQRPIAVDNVGVFENIGSHDSNIDFSHGTTAVNYTASDKAGNKAYCTFNVTIVKEQQCNLPSFKNGAFACGHTRLTEEICHVVCGSGYVINPVGLFDRHFNCQLSGDVQQLNKRMKIQEPCLAKKRPTKVLQEFSLSFIGPCNLNNSSLVSELSSHILDHLQKSDKCPFADCQFSNMTVVCGRSVKIRRFVQDKFTVKWNITIESMNGFTKGQVEAILNDIKIELMKLISALAVIVDSHQYTAEPSSVRTNPSQLVCNHGEMVFKDGCVPCPVGALHNTTARKCMLCPRGTFQPKASQVQCQRCEMDQYTREEGAISQSQCIEVPAIDEMSKFLIITACTFGFVFLCMVIFMYLQYQRQQKQARKSLTLANSNRYLMPNIYVAPPPVPKPKYFESRDYIGCHDYEDIDGAQTAKANFAAMYRIPTAGDRRDSTSSFKPSGANGDIMFRTGPSPSLSARDSTAGVQSFRTSEDTLVPSSPLDSNKSFKTSIDGSLKSPVSAHNSTGSFRSSPESPYRSPQFGRDSSSSYRTTPESPNKSPPYLYGASATAMSFRTNPEASPYRSPKIVREPNSSFKTSPESPYRTTTFIRDLNSTRQASVELPVRSQTFRPHAESPYRSVNDGSSFRSFGDSQLESPYRSVNHNGIAFRPPVDSLYKRPPSPLSVPSSRVSNDSLYKASSTPKASPNASRARLEAMFNTPPPSRSMKSFTQNRCYEYD